MELDTKINITFFVALAALAFTFWQYRRSQKIEKIRFLDRVYDAACWLLMYEHNRIQAIEFVSEDKELEKAVRQYCRAHSLAQMFGGAFEMPESFKTDDEKHEFRRKVSDAYYKHHEQINENFCNGEFSQSPVFIVQNEECKEKLDWILKTIGENRSYCSKKILEKWQRAQEATIEQVKGEYESFKKILYRSCAGLDDERVDDPFLELLLTIRSEYRAITKTLGDYVSSLLWYIGFKFRQARLNMKRLLKRA